MKRIPALTLVLAIAACGEVPTAPTVLDADEAAAKTTQLDLSLQTSLTYASGSYVQTWDPIIPDAMPSDWTTSICTAEPGVSKDDTRWTNQHNSYVVWHSWQGTLGTPWINAWNHRYSFGSGGPSPYFNWTKYQTEVTGNGTFQISLLADNCSWIYLDDDLVGVQYANWNANNLTYGLTLDGTHTLTFVVFDGGGDAGGQFLLETTTTPPPPLDSDGDGLTNIEEGELGTDPFDADTDDDGVGDAQDVEPTLNNNYYYVDWTAANPAGGTASGTITLPGGHIVTVDFRVLNPNGSAGSYYFGQTSGGTSWWSPNNYAPYTSPYVLNPPPYSDIIALIGASTSSYVITFSEPVQDPIMDILSLGSGGNRAVYDFDRPFEIVSQGVGYWGGGSNRLTAHPGEQLWGYEGHGTIRFIGSFPTFSWTVPDEEAWHGFTLAIRGAADPNADYDGDGIPDASDSCPLVPNTGGDFDNDGIDDACDTYDDSGDDTDGDGLTNGQEFVLGTSPTNPDTDGDGHNDKDDLFPLDPTQWDIPILDVDGDGFPDDIDNCPLVANTDQTDTDNDGQGDACDPDDDNDGVADGDDAFPLDPSESVDTDGDGIGNNADDDDDGDGYTDADEALNGTDPLDAGSTPPDNDGDHVSDLLDDDDDNDGVLDEVDNCSLIANADQADYDGDGLGDACDPDDDNDGVNDDVDAVQFSIMGGNLIIAGCNTGVENRVMADGTTLMDAVAAMEAEYEGNHGGFVSAVTQAANGWKDAGVISGQEKGAITACVAGSATGKPNGKGRGGR